MRFSSCTVATAFICSRSLCTLPKLFFLVSLIFFCMIRSKQHWETKNIYKKKKSIEIAPTMTKKRWRGPLWRRWHRRLLQCGGVFLYAFFLYFCLFFYVLCHFFSRSILLLCWIFFSSSFFITKIFRLFFCARRCCVYIFL